jgi:hypothetical protein
LLFSDEQIHVCFGDDSMTDMSMSGSRTAMLNVRDRFYADVAQMAAAAPTSSRIGSDYRS